MNFIPKNLFLFGLILIFAIVLIISLIGWYFFRPNPSTNQEREKYNFTLKNKDQVIKLNIEIADTPEERARGLMFRRELADDVGMLFIFDQEEEQSFWMKDTYIPLDIIFFDSNKKFVSVQQDAQPCINQGFNCPSYPSNGKIKYVLEVRAGVLDDSIYNSELRFEFVNS